MTKKKTLFTLFTVSLFALALAAVPVFGAKIESDIPTEVKQAAEEGLALFQSKVSGNPTSYGYHDASEVKQTTLGEGYQIHYVNGQKLENDNKGSLLDISEAADVWEFTVDLNGQPKSFLTIAFEDGKYRVVEFGGNAAAYGDTMKKFKQKTNQKPILVKAGPAFYFVKKSGSDELVLPAVTEKQASILGLDDATSFKPSSEVVKMLKEIQKKNKGKRG
ncbi:hypothetical protein G3578_14100 [Brevibacillus sp. SYP-B805]|uniref:hypothetical protein n=1 Tax=Brevibacillus sp. SYP-B805 TaxID=1578199 RepID=UPI0013EC3346|nr:hypothetical protein [Brevibacillus sp. SYP-B805]NGQ96294.1 hypothetical protein [Brevibacillus sp. SYP-B805]